jgi:uncharacterized protein YbjT (DUF2867 family)
VAAVVAPVVAAAVVVPRAAGAVARAAVAAAAAPARPAGRAATAAGRAADRARRVRAADHRSHAACGRRCLRPVADGARRHRSVRGIPTPRSTARAARATLRVMNPDTPSLVGTRPTLLAGATGLVGREVAAAWPGPAPLIALVRRPPADEAVPPPHVEWHRVDFDALPALPPAEDAVCALGTTIAVAGSRSAFRAVDHDAVLVFARAALASGVRRFAVVSALGADPRSRTFYSRVKGEVEQDLAELGFESLIVARPSLLDGERETLGQPGRIGEQVALALTRPLAAFIPAAWRPLPAPVLARGLLRALASAAPWRTLLDSAALQELGG